MFDLPLNGIEYLALAFTMAGIVKLALFATDHRKEVNQ